jgi:hypothetical protein
MKPQFMLQHLLVGKKASGENGSVIPRPRGKLRHHDQAHAGRRIEVFPVMETRWALRNLMSWRKE